jgi:NitT/TauT family transport system substrate-binding protein
MSAAEAPPMKMVGTRRRFLSTLAGMSAATLLRTPPSLAAEAAPEITTVRLAKIAAVCLAPQYVAEEFLRAEGFREIHYVDTDAANIGRAIGRGEVDFSPTNPVDFVQAVDAGAEITVLGGVHVGCYELFVREGIHSISELKGKTVGLRASPPAQLILMAAHVGLDPSKDIRWITPVDSKTDPLSLFVDGKLDAFLGFAPEPQEVRSHQVGHVIVRTASDEPWSQYFCCVLAGNRDFVRKHPIATKRVIRAILKAADLCSSEPERVARRVVDSGFSERYDFALEALREIPYDKWREYDAEDTLRFYALRLREVGLIRTLPQRIIETSTDWRFFNELKHELKA